MQATARSVQQKDIQNRPMATFEKFKMPTRCALCSEIATMELLTELDSIIVVEKICDACFISECR
jgi:hypothetical protein